jgi:non-specific serine/threonine protein kinase
VLKEFLAGRRALLIFDNCEHLLDAAAALAKSLLRAGDELKILATSREPLNIDGETVIRVPPLTVPEIAPAPASGNRDIAAGDAVTLFAERARSHVPDFEVTPDNINAVLQICQRLDGLPLPIELAAARLRTLSVTQILEHLTDRYRLLTAGRRTAPSRQQTLRASVDWSRDLCSPEEQRLWARMSVFAGGAQLDAIEAVCSDGESDPDVLDLVASLVDKSIVIREEPGAEVRYRMLETLRDYGRSDLVSSGEYAEVRQRHREWYFDLARRAADEWVSADRPSWAVRLTREQANLREAMDFCFESGDGGTGLLIATALYPYWLTCGRFTEGRRWLGRGQRARAEFGRPTRRCRHSVASTGQHDPHFPDDGALQDRCEDQLRKSLGARELTASRKRGAAMSRDEAAAFALDEQPPAIASAEGEIAKLTKREREVAALVAQGLTNKAIAESLVVSRRTAQGHVENILMKLGYNSRAQIATWMTQQQVAASAPSAD